MFTQVEEVRGNNEGTVAHWSEKELPRTEGGRTIQNYCGFLRLSSAKNRLRACSRVRQCSSSEGKLETSLDC